LLKTLSQMKNLLYLIITSVLVSSCISYQKGQDGTGAGTGDGGEGCGGTGAGTGAGGDGCDGAGTGTGTGAGGEGCGTGDGCGGTECDNRWESKKASNAIIVIQQQQHPQPKPQTILLTFLLSSSRSGSLL
jgi:hypothetical protein